MAKLKMLQAQIDFAMNNCDDCKLAAMPIALASVKNNI